MKKGKGNNGTGSNKPKSSKTKKPKRPSPNPHGRSDDEAPRQERRNRIHREIKARTFPNKKSLARLLEVCDDTIDSDFEYLRRMGMPLEYDKYKKGFYYRYDVPDLPNVQITEQEIGALAATAQLSTQLPGKEMQNALQSISKKLQSGLPKEMRKKTADLGKFISIRYSHTSLIDPAAITRLFHYVMEEKQIRLEYRRPGEREYKPRVFDPLHLVCVNGEWFLFAYDHYWKTVLRFAPIRMRNIEETGVPFERPANFCINKELEKSFGIHSGDGNYDIVLRTNFDSSDYIREKHWRGENKKVELPCGGIELHLTLSSLVEIERTVISHLGNTVVLAPPAFQQRVLASAQKFVCEQLKACAETAEGNEGLGG